MGSYGARYGLPNGIPLKTRRIARFTKQKLRNRINSNLIHRFAERGTLLGLADLCGTQGPKVLCQLAQPVLFAPPRELLASPFCPTVFFASKILPEFPLSLPRERSDKFRGQCPGVGVSFGVRQKLGSKKSKAMPSLLSEFHLKCRRPLK